MKQFNKAERSNCKIKMAVQGPSGSGKTYSSLLVAYGLTKDWSKIAVLDTENGSASLYSHLGSYSVLNLAAPYTPEEYIDAIDAAVKQGFECLIIDSLSTEWNGVGGILDIHGNIPGNSFTAWAKVTPRHNAFVQAILQSNIHIIGTMRSKTDYVISEKNGKQVPEKVGMKPVQREDSEYEFTVVFELNQKHQANVGKDRTGLFSKRPELFLTAEVGDEISQWCKVTDVQPAEIKSDVAEMPELQDGFIVQINACKTVEELGRLFNANPTHQRKYRSYFSQRKNEIELLLNNFLSNGIHN
jgi:hypothetical protein